MSGRITEAELLDEERGVIHHNVMGIPVEGISRARLVDEIRRLRGLIAPAAQASGLGVHSSTCDLTAASPCAFCRAMDPLAAEAHAIRDEQDLTRMSQS